jgi:phenylalanyl-tRNA synthetase beta chain
MKVSYNWLNEKVNSGLPAEDIAHKITMAGLEVDSIEKAAPAFTKVIVAEITSMKKHPDADKLNCCQVNTGKKTLSIVCGAPNAREGMKVALAQVGAELPGDLSIKKGEIRGELSEGMLCSNSELGLSDDHDGILDLPSDAPVGQDYREWLALDDEILDVDLTPNRGDCLSMRGVAREVSTLTNKKLKLTEFNEIKATIKEELEVKLGAPEACPRYLGRIIKEVDQETQTPIWMQERLRRADIRPNSIIVDILNYVMVCIGQPMHAFDLDRLSGNIKVRFAKNNEKLTLLDGEEATLTKETLIIADGKGPVAIAGIMGGLDSSVTNATNDIFLESAFFAPDVIAGKGRLYNLHTDASHRFERGVDFNLPREAIELATDLILTIAGGDAGPVLEAVDKKHLPKRAAIQFTPERASQLLGVTIPEKTVEKILISLGMEIDKKEKHWLVTPPSYRFDIEIVEDLVEEVGRIFGYDNIPVTDFAIKLDTKIKSSQKIDEHRIKSLLQDRGYAEAITYSFVSPDSQRHIDPDHEAIPLVNPISADMSVMRTSLWPGLLSALHYNLNRQQPRVRLFELGRRFIKGKKAIDQALLLSGVVVGSAMPEQWGADANKTDFFDVKSDIEALLALMGFQDRIQFVPAEHSALHPGQTANILLDKKVVGVIGRLHPRVQQKLQLKVAPIMFELLYEEISEHEKVVYEPISAFPAVRRDFAFLIDQEVSADALLREAKRVMGSLLVDKTIFDVFEDDDLEKGKKSVAIGLTLQDPSRTLRDEEISELSAKLISTLGEQFNATLRD